MLLSRLLVLKSCLLLVPRCSPPLLPPWSCWRIGFSAFPRIATEVPSTTTQGETMNQATPSRRKSILSWLTAAALLSAAVFSSSSPGTAATPDGARVVKYSKEDIIPVHAKLRFSTLIVLPASEEILEFTTADKEFWIINAPHNHCYFHPAQAG